MTRTRTDALLPPPLLAIALLAIPQVGETILAPALPDLARRFGVDPGVAQWVMGIFFAGFAVGVLLWGVIADHWGRRPALLCGLATALAGTLCAALANGFGVLLFGRLLQGLGLATCSVTTQTMLRDRLDGPALTRYFITVGMVLAWSPAVGPLNGQLLADHLGYRGVLYTLAFMLACIAMMCGLFATETRPAQATSDRARQPSRRILPLACRMATDRDIRCAIVLVAGLNTLVFSFYAAGPFMVGPLPGLGFGWAGLAAAVAGSLGAALNRWLPARADTSARVAGGLYCALAGAIAQFITIRYLDQPGPSWAISALPIFVGYGLAIPNILSPALRAYRECAGRAGALFGLAYYTVIGLALGMTSMLPFGSPTPLSICWLAVTCLLLANKP